LRQISGIPPSTWRTKGKKHNANPPTQPPTTHPTLLALLAEINQYSERKKSSENFFGVYLITNAIEISAKSAKTIIHTLKLTIPAQYVIFS
jgi:hypothetical protein